jgi:hypothetical protein
VLGDEKIMAEARLWIEAALASQREDGWFGPRANLRSPRAPSRGKPDLWPNMIMLNALQSHHEYLMMLSHAMLLRVTGDAKWADGDKLSLRLPMQVRITRWTANQNSVSVSRGPLTYSLKIGERYVRVGGDDRWPAWAVHPTTPWNYALALDERDPASSFEVVTRPWPQDGQPFEAESAPIALRARARRILAWTKDALGLVGRLSPSPVRADEPEETVTLTPMGCAPLRISALPVVGSGPDARPWREPGIELP